MFSFKRFFLAGLSTALLCLPTFIRAEVALVEKLNGPTGSNGWLFSEAENSDSYGNEDKTWSPGFRTASSSDATYVVGWATVTLDSSTIEDGFISRIGPAGSEVWSQSMRAMMGTHAGSLGWKVDDVAVLEDAVYVCGQNSDNVAFIAKMTLNGSLVDYSLIAAKKDTDSGLEGIYSRAYSIAVSRVRGESTVVVTGGIQGDSMLVKERQVAAAQSTFSNLKIDCDYNDKDTTDAYVIQFDGDLKATWGTTLGFRSSDDTGTAVEIDPTGSIFLALKVKDHDPGGTANLNNIDNGRHVVIRGGTTDGKATEIINGVYSGTNFIKNSSLSMLLRLDTSDAKKSAPVVSYFQPCLVEMHEDGQAPAFPDTGPKNGSDSRIQDITYSDGSLYVAGEWKGILRPVAHGQSKAASFSSLPRSDNDFDVFVAKLDAVTLHHSDWRLYQSNGEDYASELTVSSEGVYLAGTAGQGLWHRNTLTWEGEGTSIGGSSTPHLFWAKLGKTDLSHTWQVFPVESGGDYLIPSHMRSSGVAFIGDTVILTGYWKGGSLSFGETAKSNVKTLSDPDPKPAGFVGFLTSHGAWLNDVEVRIKSEYGDDQVKPYLGLQQFTVGASIVASVPSEVYEDAAGNILDAENTELINASAVTRRICTGYQFQGSSVNGTAHSVRFEASGDIELTFLWRTEHAIEIYSDIASVEGLSSTAAGDPFPVVQKHWIAENEQFTAFIDGAATISTENGTRWRSTGYLATGAVAAAADVEDSSMLYWPSFQNRQQTPKVTVAGPGSITWRWQKEYSVRVGVNSSVAESAPSVLGIADAPDIVRRATQSSSVYEFAYEAFGVRPSQLKLRLPNAEAATYPFLPHRLVVECREDDLDEWAHYGHYSFTYASFDVGEIVTFDLAEPDDESGSLYRKQWRVYTQFQYDFGAGLNWYLYLLGFDLCELGEVTIDPSKLSLAKITHSGTGEYWFKAGARITASSAATVNSGLSVLSLQGYLGAQGSIAPPESDTAPAPFILTEPTSITWDYGPTIYKETVTIGNAVTFSTVTGDSATRINKTKQPSTGSISDGPSGSSWAEMHAWDVVAQKLYPLRPGVFTVEFENTSAPTDAAKNIIVEVTATWPTAADYDHILEAPAVDLDPSAVDTNAFIQLAYTEGDGTVDGANLFSANEEGRSVLVFSERTGSVATGNLQQESLNIKVVNSMHWSSSVGDLINVAIGTAVTDPGHDSATVGHNGYVLTNYAPVNVNVYDRNSLMGPIFPINKLSSVTNQVATPGDLGGLAIAWYQVQDSIRWPYKAQSYDPYWPNSTDRIFIASQLGSEGSSSGSTLGVPSGQHDARVDQASPLWKRPTDDMSAVSNFECHYEVSIVNPQLEGDGFWFIGWDTSSIIFLYEDGFDPAYPLNNLIASQRSSGFWQQLAFVSADKTYYAVVTQYDQVNSFGQFTLDIDGGGVVSTLQYPYFEKPNLRDLVIYQQPDSSQMGYNPNEEHALIAPSFLEASRPAAFALRNDLNVTTSDLNYTSEPYVLVQYEDLSDAENPVVKMGVYEVEEEDESVVDARLPEFNQKYTYLYENEAGQRLLPPYPLDLVIGGAGTPEETSGIHVDDRIAYFEDKNHMPWVVSGDEDAAADIEAAWYYPLRADFWHPTASLGEAVALGDLTLDSNGHNIEYNTVWPSDAPVLKAGETLTFAGGEYATDHSGDVTPPQGLPQAVAWQSGELVFDDGNAMLDPDKLKTSGYMARLVPVLEAREVSLALTDMPAELTPASGDVTVDGLYWHFDALPASLKDRIYYDTNKQVLGVRGILNGYVIGDRDLLSTPGAQTILQPNILTAAAEALVKKISSNLSWETAVEQLAALSLDPNQTNAPDGVFMAGLDIDSGTGELRPAPALGPGLAVVTNPKLQDPSTSESLPDGYITIAENNAPELSSPVAMHVIKVSREKYRGSIAVLEPSNVFDEKLSLRHTADFGGNVKDLYFEWYIREEDGRDLNPPGVDQPGYGEPIASDWTLFQAGRGLSAIEMAGAGPVLIRDNLLYCRYGFSDDDSAPTEWSAYAGAANSREPDEDSPSAATDEAYVAQLAPGWIKRVTNAVNAFDARFNDFQNHGSPATYSSMLQQAGQRHEGAVAFNPDKDAIENVGLIELYQTVLDRAEDMTIATASGTSGVNAALLNAANRIAALYVLLGNEAFADALDPTIGYSTQSGAFGTLAPTIHAFENVTSSLLEEELTLLRGRSEVGARPSYNRLIWNFTNGSGEAAYVMNYDINDLSEDGFIDDVDARRLYPQGHGDAWGHYTMALTGYYRLAQIDNFTWEPRSEKYNIDGIVLNVDYLDERAFAKAAAARAQCGAQLVDMVYREKYTDNPDGQWQGYTDTNTDRAWGVFETAQRTGTAALFDWMMGNAVLQAEETDPLKTGIRRVDRSTVGELAQIAAHGHAIQSTLNMADSGMNPAGLDPNVVPFDIDPVRTDRRYDDPATHFEQVYERAVDASRNALRTFEHANAIALQLRQTEASSEQLRKEALDQDLSYRNQLIELFGTPHDGMIGAGKAYPAGYNGPDLYLYLYVDQVAAGGDILPEFDGTVVETTIVPGLRNLANDTNPFEPGSIGVDSELLESVSNYFPADLELPAGAIGEITLNLPRSASGYALTAPSAWGARRGPGEIQAAIQNLVQSEWQLRMAVHQYESQAEDFQNLLKKFELISGIASASIGVSRDAGDDFGHWSDVATSMYALSLPVLLAGENAELLSDAIAEALPTSVGLSTDGTAPARSIAKMAGASVLLTAAQVAIPLQIAQYRAEIEMDAAIAELDQALVTQDRKIEIVELLFEINDLVNRESDALIEVVNALESMRAASDRVASTIEKGQALIEARTVFNQRVAATTTKHRYEDYTFRVFHSEALRKYRSSFDLATRYAYLAGKAYQFELNLPDNHAANASPILSSLLRERTLGEWDEAGEPVIGQSGVAEHLAILKANFETLKGQLGFNNPTDEVTTFSLRRELERVGMSSRVNGDWRTALEGYRVPDLWNYEYESNGVNYGYVFRRFCRPFAGEATGAQPALVIPFSTEIAAGKNWFGKGLSGGDSSFNASNFSTKIRSLGVQLTGYNNTTLSNTPQVYLVPVGSDKMFLPQSTTLESRSWNVVDQRIPAPLPISSSNLTDPDWQPYSGSANGFFEDIRKFSSFRAYHDAGGWSAGEMLNNGRHVGRSVWNSQWVLIIPNASLLFDSSNTQAGIDTLIYGAPLPGYDQSTAGRTNRDGIGIQDIQILLDTYSISGN